MNIPVHEREPLRLRMEELRDNLPDILKACAWILLRATAMTLGTMMIISLLIEAATIGTDIVQGKAESRTAPENQLTLDARNAIESGATGDILKFAQFAA